MAITSPPGTCRARGRTRCATQDNVLPSHTSGAVDEFVREVVPELQRRGLFRRAHEGTTQCVNLGLEIPMHTANMLILEAES
ncbi:hypothetical protein SAMN07250955_105139 [Arboricoccus pini]|uniref:Uncharacterized protein n=1 Tax=Arboricoccus pini TaxID=1963835 RepID=A0A212R3S2_9PROT|nr:hypothetical protein [Arboricoccus pini]SNB66576.1 hypothetical protein SAMN07250955_105139 [Arboricoccus pini]